MCPRKSPRRKFRITFTKSGAGLKKKYADDWNLAPVYIFHYGGGGGGGDVKGCMLNTGVSHSASASYSFLHIYHDKML